MGQVELSFVIPAFNEEDSIEIALCTLDVMVKDKMLPYEIVVVDDGSKDTTLTKAITYASRNGHVKVVSYDENVGKGYAVKAGFMQASGDVVVFADSDMEIDMSTILSYVDALDDGDVVIASKWHPESVVEMPLTRRILSHSFNVLVRILTGANLKDTQVGLKVIRKSVFKNIFPRLTVKRYAFDVELLAVAKLYGARIVEMPVKLKICNPFKIVEIWKMFIDLLGIAYRLRVLRFYRKTHVKR
jgi:glycosyltransferase involved in cell wall biosynthesis